MLGKVAMARCTGRATGISPSVTPLRDSAAGDVVRWTTSAWPFEAETTRRGLRLGETIDMVRQ
ncbi:MAG: hypothetical protein ACREHD_33690 [Pirellulales bacterium]